MPSMLIKLAIAATVAILAANLSGCGRKGDLEAPGAYESQKSADPAAAKPATTEDKPFILDPLL